MAHTYASVADLKNYIKDQGSASSGGLGTGNDAMFLTFLGSASREIDKHCARTRGRAPSGFGPRIGTNRYDGPGGRCLELDDDLIALTGTVSVAPSLGSSAETFTDETDFYKEPYDGAPYRSLVLHGSGQPSWYATRRGVSVPGKWGYQDDRVTSTATLAENLDTTETGVDVSDGTAFAIGQTILVDSEQLHVTAIATNTLTVVRGANGTTAASHTSGAAIDVYRYPNAIVVACLVLAHSRWKQRDAGLVGNFGGGDIPVTTPQATEWKILRDNLGDFTIWRLT